MDTIALVEAAYRMDDTTEVWLDGIVRRATPIFESAGGEGSAGLVIDATRTTATAAHLIAVALDGIPGEAPAAFSAMLSLGIQPTTITRIRRAGPVGTLSAALGGSFDELGGFRDQLRKHALGDAGHVVAGDPLRVSCILATTFPRRHAFSGEQSLLWQLLAAHVSAGLRLRTRQLTAADDEAHVEAVLDPDGRLQHATEDARTELHRARLRDAARDLIRARGSARRSDPLAALSLWQALVAGRWSLVDRVESDGRRFLLACRNEPEARARRAMTHREAQVATLVGLGHANKVVAYELGISLSSVSTHLRRALRKLGVASRTELIELFLRSVP